MARSKEVSNIHDGSKYRALPAEFHFFAPALLRLSAADGSIDEPAEMSCLEFPRRTVLTGLRSAASNLPARAHFSIGLVFEGP